MLASRTVHQFWHAATIRRHYLDHRPMISIQNPQLIHGYCSHVAFGFKGTRHPHPLPRVGLPQWRSQRGSNEEETWLNRDNTQVRK